MIEFKTITVKNFGSYGNHPTTINLNTHNNTLVVGKNGKGKSTILLDGIFFVLFNKPYRKVTKTQLINSINKSGTIVEICFDTRGSSYKVTRGIKPNVFVIEKDGEVLDSNVLSKDLQDHLEQDILQLNLRTFSQTVVLGSTSYIPFMQLDASKRREVVDDVLDVWVYSRMAENAKDDLSVTNKEITSVSHQFDLTKAEAVAIHKLLSVLKDNKTQLVDQIREDIVSLEALRGIEADKIQSLEMSIMDLEAKIEPVDGYKEATAKLQSISHQIRVLESKGKELDSLVTCPTCLQKVDDNHKHLVSEKANAKLASLKDELDVVKETLESLDKIQQINMAYQKSIDDLRSDIRFSNKEMSRIDADLQQLRTRLVDASADSEERINEETDKLKSIIAENKNQAKKLEELREKKAIQELSVKLLKDSGIKAAIVKEYLPVLNGLINEYLTAYNFEINFTLDDTFSETVQSRGRENFSYHSFSEGEKEKIDYAIMLALRKIAASKNASNINVLVLDEILDGSLDEESRSATLQLLTEGNEKSNIFVISHTESNPGYYDRILKVDKRGDFSYITEEA